MFCFFMGLQLISMLSNGDTLILPEMLNIADIKSKSLLAVADSTVLCYRLVL